MKAKLIRLDGMLKAKPVQDGARRLLYFEASNESLDTQGEIVLQKALADSSDYFLRHGNIDLDHITKIGPEQGIVDFMEYGIGKPIEVKVQGRRTFVKAELYQGNSPMAKRADMVWQSMTQQEPPSRWYPSISFFASEFVARVDKETGEKVNVITKLSWDNIGLTHTPANTTLPETSLMPVGTLSKSLGIVVRPHSISGVPYTHYRDDIAAKLRNREISPRRIEVYLTDKRGLSAKDARQVTLRWLGELRDKLQARK